MYVDCCARYYVVALITRCCVDYVTHTRLVHAPLRCDFTFTPRALYIRSLAIGSYVCVDCVTPQVGLPAFGLIVPLRCCVDCSCPLLDCTLSPSLPWTHYPTLHPGHPTLVAPHRPSHNTVPTQFAHLDSATLLQPLCLPGFFVHTVIPIWLVCITFAGFTLF